MIELVYGVVETLVNCRHLHARELWNKAMRRHGRCARSLEISTVSSGALTVDVGRCIIFL